MISSRAAMILILAVIGNFGFWLFLFNRLNAAGLPRWLTKLIEKAIVAASFALPLVIALIDFHTLGNWLFAETWWPSGSRLFKYWGAWSVASACVLGPMWLESRRWLLPPSHLRSQKSRRQHLNRVVPGGCPGDLKTRWVGAVPGNQIFQLDVTEKELQLPRRIPAADGLTIGHISDLHFTGQFRKEHYRRVIEQLLELEPELIALTGDIIDKDHCIEWIGDILAPLQAPLGSYFVLGNHDKRVSQMDAALSSAVASGLADLGVADARVETESLRMELFGNEIPWFNRHMNHGCLPIQEELQSGARRTIMAAGGPWASTRKKAESPQPEAHAGQVHAMARDSLRIALTHSPDQIRWARKYQVDLLLAGHTHGGQIRIPGVGPLVSPSYYGSKFASGVFYLEPTLMHVSRGVAGTHPYRWRCPPEISLLRLRSPD